MKLEVQTVLAQWACGGLFFCWVTTRHRVLGIGYGWLLRCTYGALAAISIATGAGSVSWLLLVGVIGMLLASAVALGASIILPRRSATNAEGAAITAFPPLLDVIAPVLGVIGLFGAADDAGGSYLVALLRLVVGAAFLGVISDAMLLGHWYLVQPGLSRDPLKELVRAIAIVWPFEVVVFLWKPGMAQVLSGSISDGYNGLLGWVWVACAVFTLGLAGVTWLALRERYYSAVMSATGLLYLAILTGFGVDLVARAVLAP